MKLYAGRRFFERLRAALPRTQREHLHGIQVVEDLELPPGQAELRGEHGIESRRVTLVGEEEE
jgi:lipase chaperone LimK